MVQVHCHEETLTLPQEQPQIPFHRSSPCSENCQDLCAVTLSRRQRDSVPTLCYKMWTLIPSGIPHPPPAARPGSPVLAHWTAGITKPWSLQTGTAFHGYTAKAASREHSSTSPSPLSICIFGKVLFIREETPLAWSKIQVSRLSKYDSNTESPCSIIGHTYGLYTWPGVTTLHCCVVFW